MTANFLLQLRVEWVGGEGPKSFRLVRVVLRRGPPCEYTYTYLCAILLGNDYSSGKNQQPPTFRLFRPGIVVVP